MEAQNRKYVTDSELAEIISCSRRYVCELRTQGVIPFVKLGRKCVRIPLEKALKKLERLEISK